MFKKLMSITVGLLATLSLLVSVQPAAAAGPYSFSWVGTPTSPQAWRPSTGFDVVVHDRDFSFTYDNPYSFNAQHGADCGAFQGFGVGGTHVVSTYADEVFVCNNHLMTGVNGQGYGEISLTPGYLLDWSTGPVSVTWQVDTLRTSCRDWLSYHVTPFLDNLMLTDGFGVDLYGEPKNGLTFTTGASCPSAFTGSDFRNFVSTAIPGPGGAVADVVSETLATSATNRQTFELDISSTHVRFGMPAYNKWFVDGNLTSPLPYSQGVFAIGHHSYTPDKDCVATTTYCAANTWHWANINISNGQPFTILRGDKFQLSPNHLDWGYSDTEILPSPTPANSYLRFEALGNNVAFSVDGGLTWITPTHQQYSEKNPTGAFTDAQTQLFFWPIPAGVTQVKFQAADVYWSGSAIRNVSVWSLTV